MLGNQQIPGIMLLTVKDIFETIKDRYTDKEFNIVVSYVEIYNETIRDLLVPSSSYLDLRDDPTKAHKDMIILFNRIFREPLYQAQQNTRPNL